MTPEQFWPLLRNLGLLVAVVMTISFFLFLLMMALAYRRIRTLDIPPDADITLTLQLVPIYLVLAIDFLDLALDILAAPVTWVILDRLGLKALRNVSTLEALIPLTGPIPTFTLSWLAVRLLGSRMAGMERL